jgi:excisionase family DNA binding protein
MDEHDANTIASVPVRRANQQEPVADARSAPAPSVIHRLGPPLLTAEEVAAHLNCSVELVYKLRRLKRLPAVRLGAVYRWRATAVQSFLDAQEG